MNVRIESNIGQRMELTVDQILRFLTNSEDPLDEFVILNPSKTRLVTTNVVLYEALGSIKPYDEFKLNKLTKLMETVFVKTVEKPKVLTEERIDEIRKQALKLEE